MQFTISNFTHSDYYKTGTITVSAEGRTFIINRSMLTTDNDKRYLHQLTNWMEEESFGWSENKQMHWIAYDHECNGGDWTEEVNYQCDPIADDDHEVTWLNGPDFHEYLLDNYVSESAINCDEHRDMIVNTITRIIDEEQAKIIHALKFGNGPIVIHSGFLTRLKSRNPDMTYDDLLSERTGEEHNVLAVAGNYAIIQEDSRYTVVLVNSNEAEPCSSFNTYDAAVAYIESELVTA